MAATRIIQEALSGAPQPEAAPPRRERLRKPLREALRTLREGRGRVGWQLPGAPAPAPAVPHGARFEARSFACAEGARDYRLYLPADTGAPLRGLVLMLHGCKQNPDDFAAGTGMNALAERHGLAIAYPGQTAAENPAACWNWFRPGDQHRGAGEPAILAGLARSLAAELGIPPDRIFAAGLSAGGAMAAVLGAAYPEVFSAVGIHSGLPAGAANDVLSAFAAMRGDPTLPGPRPSGPGPPHHRLPRQRRRHGRRRERRADHGNRRHRRGIETETGTAPGRRSYTRTVHPPPRPDGSTQAELWLVDGAGHAWSGARRRRFLHRPLPAPTPRRRCCVSSSPRAPAARRPRRPAPSPRAPAAPAAPAPASETRRAAGRRPSRW